MTTDAPPTTLAAFLVARFDKTEAAVKEHSEPWPLAGAYSWIRNEINDYDLHADPAHVLADLAAKRRIVEMHAPDGSDPRFSDCRVCAHDEDFSDDSEGNREYSRRGMPWPCPTLRALALPYADHPDYRQEWRP